MIYVISTRYNTGLPKVQKALDKLRVYYDTLALQRKGNLQKFTFEMFLGIVKNIDPIEHDDFILALLKQNIPEEDLDRVYDMTLRELYDYIIEEKAQVLRSVIIYDDEKERVFIGFNEEELQSAYSRASRKQMLEDALMKLRAEEDKTFAEELDY